LGQQKSHTARSIQLKLSACSGGLGSSIAVASARLFQSASIGIKPLTANSYYVTLTIAAGKGWGDFDIQGTVGTPLPTNNFDKLGPQLSTNVTLQYHLLEYFWPEVELNNTYWFNGVRGGLDQLFLSLDAIHRPISDPRHPRKGSHPGWLPNRANAASNPESAHADVQSQLAIRSAVVLLTVSISVSM
jgi:hypothetical protein